MRHPMQRRVRAQVFAITAVVMVAMVGALAMVIDAGMFFVIQRNFQSAADAGALAGAWHDPICPSPGLGCDFSRDAKDVAHDVALANAASMASLCGSPVEVSIPQPGTRINVPANVNVLVVTVQCKAGYSLGRIFNLTPFDISASSAAGIGERTVTREMGNMPSSGPCASPPAPPPPDPHCAIDFSLATPQMTCVEGPPAGLPPCLIARLIE
jgi:hypothetical protein